MSRDDDFIAELEDYLDTYEGVVPLPASVRDAVLARLPETRQVRGAGRPERMLDMASRLSAPARWAVGIAAVLVIVVGVAAVFTGGSMPGIGAAPTSSPSPSASPTPAGSPTASPSGSADAGLPRLGSGPKASCGEGMGTFCVPAGTYRLSNDVWPSTVVLDIPEGWFQYQAAPDFEGVLVERPDAINGSGWGVVLSLVDQVVKDPCDSTAGRFTAAETSTVDGVLAALRSWRGFQVSEATPIEVDGHPGQQVTVAATESFEDCGEAASSWMTPSGYLVDIYPMGGTQRLPATFRLVQVDDDVVLIRASATADTSPFELSQGIAPDPQRHAADLPELQQIIDSIRFD